MTAVITASWVPYASMRVADMYSGEYARYFSSSKKPSGVTTREMSYGAPVLSNAPADEIGR